MAQQFQLLRISVPNTTPSILPPRVVSLGHCALPKGTAANPNSVPLLSSTHKRKLADPSTTRALSLDEIPPNALRRNRDPLWRGGFSLGVDLGMTRTGLALSKGFSIRPLTVLELRGQKLELRLLEIAEQQEVDEFIIGIPKSYDGKETPQSNKVRSVAGRFAVQAAERGWRVYLQDEHGTSIEAIAYTIDTGLKKSTRQGSLDAYAAMMILERYFSTVGQETELVVPKLLKLHGKIRTGPPKDVDFFPE